ncbi:phospholipase-like protein [Tanacetum coccineum]
MDKDAAAPIITIKANIDATVKEIRGALTDTQVQIFKKTCFGHWLDISLKRNNQLLIHTLLTCMVDSVANELSFLVSGKRIRFRRQEFCLVTGLRFGSNMYMKEWVKNMAENSFRNRIFPDIEARSVKLSDVIAIFDKMRGKSLVLEDNDAVKICLLVLLQHGFLGHQMSHNISNEMLMLVEDLSNCWNIFPWGSYIWDHTYPQLRDALNKRQVSHDDKREKGAEIRYTLTGFVYAFMIWILEAIPATHVYVSKEPMEKIPRAFAWKMILPFSWARCRTLFVGDNLAPPLETLTPTKAESESDWWKTSLEYFEGKGVQSEAVSEQLEIEKDSLSEEVQKKKKRKRGSSPPSFQNPTYEQLMTRVSTLEGTVTTLTQTVSSLQGSIGTLESRLLALEGDARVSTLTQTVSSLQGTIATLESRLLALEPLKDTHLDDSDAAKDAAKDTHLDAVTTISVPMTTTESSMYGTLDCGVMTCKFIEMLTKGKTIDAKKFGANVAKKCQEFRAKMALMLYDTREDMYNIKKKISDATGVVENIESNDYFCYFQKPNCDLNVGLQQLWTEEDYMDLYMYIGHGKTQFLHIYIVKEEINEECEACRASSSAESEGIVII